MLVAAFVEAYVATKTERRISSPPDVITRDARESMSWCEDANVTEQTLAHARGGDEDAFRDLTDRYRRVSVPARRVRHPPGMAVGAGRMSAARKPGKT
jgi:hypothetical protein